MARRNTAFGSPQLVAIVGFVGAVAAAIHGDFAIAGALVAVSLVLVLIWLGQRGGKE